MFGGTVARRGLVVDVHGVVVEDVLEFRIVDLLDVLLLEPFDWGPAELVLDVRLEPRGSRGVPRRFVPLSHPCLLMVWSILLTNALLLSPSPCSFVLRILASLLICFILPSVRCSASMISASK